MGALGGGNKECVPETTHTFILPFLKFPVKNDHDYHQHCI